MTATISVSWVSVNNDPYERAKNGSYLEPDGEKTPGPTLEFLFNAASPIASRVKKHYVFVRRPRTPETGGRLVHPREADVADELVKAIEGRKGAPEVELVWWDTDAAPTDHRELFLFTARALASIRRANPRADIVVNISPGTPAAQTVMLLALQARLAGDDVRAVQSTPRDKRRGPNDLVRAVPWNLLAELAATPTEVDDAGTRPTEWSLERARSPRLREVATLVNQYGGVPFPVLIMGARGTGKTEIARRLREGFREWTAQSLSKWDFHLNCAEFRGDANMLRSALFGQVKGAHSQAMKDEAGLLEKAADDCVFLDEIHWMDPQAQGLLLVALQRKGSIRRIGGDKSIPAKFRLVAATNQPRTILREKLTPDFLDRVSDLIIELPELRDCREDLGDIWRSVVRRACEELVHRDPARAIGSGTGAGRVDDLIAEFQPHHAKVERAIGAMRLAGNFRDLEKLARRLLVGGLAKGRFLSLKDEFVRSEIDRLRKEERIDAEQGSGPATSLVDELPTVARCEDYLREVRDAGTVLPGPATVDEWERRLLLAAHAVGGSGAKAAALLGMNARTFNAKMEKWDTTATSTGKGRLRAPADFE
ncbi:sigma 54-interacting transcriptional regulator [Corallococcus exiguus]|uniref:sigma 54-interacting transcriptional regulator n=1 Tax=Corallococcus exiguus TaxID=83462 RepID=UPI001494759A|nr:sigma 54-interacting transcriptional regulator [Corallococcus exiguus]NPC68952.1 sigma 54-interacting transcriptional regulator [Corallococcus exiguus]